jgi:3-phosphoglycerate kinase
VNDAFGTAHRAHASTEGVTKFLKPSVAGFLLQKVRARCGGLCGGRRAMVVWQGAVRLRGVMCRRGCGGAKTCTRVCTSCEYPHTLVPHVELSPPPPSRHTHTHTHARTHAHAHAQELDYLDGAVTAPKKPFAAIVGGSKVSSKITVIESLLDKVDVLIIG